MLPATIRPRTKPSASSIRRTLLTSQFSPRPPPKWRPGCHGRRCGQAALQPGCCGDAELGLGSDDRRERGLYRVETASHAESGVGGEHLVDDMGLGLGGRCMPSDDGLGVDAGGGRARGEHYQVKKWRSEPGVRPVSEQDALASQKDVVRVSVEVHQRPSLRGRETGFLERDQRGEVGCGPRGERAQPGEPVAIAGQVSPAAQPRVVGRQLNRYGVEVTATGPKASQVLATLTRSPASVVLAPGPAFAVPRGWRWHDFGGIRFATPGAWRLARSDRWGSCDSRPVEPGTLLLSTATTFGCRGGMEMIPPLARSWAPTSGVTVGAGRLATADATPGVYRRCIRLRGMRTCIPHEGMQVGEFLILVAYPRGRPGPTLVEIGLAGNGATARTIFDSIRPR